MTPDRGSAPVVAEALERLQPESWKQQFTTLTRRTRYSIARWIAPDDMLFNADMSLELDRLTVANESLRARNAALEWFIASDASQDYGLVEIAAERVGLTPAALRAQGCDESWYRNPQNMPPPPGSSFWVPKGSPLWNALNDADKKAGGAGFDGDGA